MIPDLGNPQPDIEKILGVDPEVRARYEAILRMLSSSQELLGKYYSLDGKFYGAISAAFFSSSIRI